MLFASLGSGSSGNALIVVSGSTRILLDCGFGLEDINTRLARFDLTPDDLTAVLVTHEHSDHICGVEKFIYKHKLPVWLTHGTFSMIQHRIRVPELFHLIDSHNKFSIMEMEIEPFPVPHDAREPVQYVFSDGNKRLGVLTDTGCSTPHIEATLSQCDALVLECNHDLEMLRSGNYPPGLKQRIAGRFGHLDNAESAKLLSRLDTKRLQHIIAAHLSEANNTPQLAKAALSNVLNCAADWIGIADQHQGFAWREIM